MEFGIKQEDLTYIVSKIEGFDEIKGAVIFGSRAKGNYKMGSDIDIAILGDDITFDTISKLKTILEDESHMPYLFDIIDYTHLEHIDIKSHIDRVGRIIFER